MVQQNTDMLDGLQAAVITDAQKKVNKSKYEFDSLKMYFGEDYEVAGIKISEPTIGDILRIGENNFYQFLNQAASLFLLLFPLQKLSQIHGLHFRL